MVSTASLEGPVPMSIPKGLVFDGILFSFKAFEGVKSNSVL